MINAAFNMQEAVSRMNRRNNKAVRWTLPNVTVEWKYIKVAEARNWDGSNPGTAVEQKPDPCREVLQQMTWREGSDPRWSNWW